MKNLIFITILSCCFITTISSQTPHKFSEAHLKSTALAVNENPDVPTNLADIFSGEIAGKIAMEVGSWVTTAGSLAGIILIPPNGVTTSFFTATYVAGIGGIVGTAQANGAGYNYDIKSWAPYVKYDRSEQNEETSQRVDFNIDLIKCPDDKESRYVAISAEIFLMGADEFEDGESNIRRSKYMDQYTFKIVPKNKDLAKMKKSFPNSVNGVANYSRSISLNVSGDLSASTDDAASGTIGASYGYTSSVSVNTKDFALENSGVKGNGIVWSYNMSNAYDDDKMSSLYKSPFDLVVGNAATKWLKTPAPLAMGANNLTLFGIFSIDINETKPVVFEYEGIQQMMHVEVLGRWGLPGAKLSGISVAVPSYNVVKGTITVTPNPTNPALATITINRELSKSFTIQNFMDYVNTPLPQLNPPILASGCYAISQAIEPNYKNYITHNGGPGVIHYNANRGVADTWEKISLVYRGKSKKNKDIDTYAFYSQDGRYIQAQGIDMVRKSTVLGDWEKWEVIPIPGTMNKYHVKNVGHNRYLSGHRHLAGNLGTSSEANEWEVWSFEPQAGGCATSPIRPFKTGPKKAPTNLVIKNESESFSVADNTNTVNITQALDQRSFTHSDQTNALVVSPFGETIPELTIEAWINNSTVQNDIQAIVSATTPEFVHFQMSGDNNVNNAVYVDFGKSISLPVIPKLNNGWHHVAISVKSGDSRVYLDGQQIGPTNTEIFNSIIPAPDFFIGRGWDGQRAFKGDIANVKIWKKALNEAELNASKNDFTDVSSPLMAYHSPTLRPLEISNSDSSVSIPNHATSGLNSLTIEAWINNQSGGESIQSIVSSSTTDFVHLQTSADANVQNVIYTENGAVTLPVIPKLTNGWHHIALVAESGNSRIYVDGKLLGNPNPMTFNTILTSYTANVGKGWAGGRIFNGNISDVRIWKNRVLTQQQIETYRHTPPHYTADRLAYHSN